MKSIFLLFKNLLALSFILILGSSYAQETLLLRQPAINGEIVAFAYGSDIWTYHLTSGLVKRITSTQAVESNPYISPDGKTIAFSSNRVGAPAVYTVPTEGGEPTRLTWHPSESIVRGWNPDGSQIIYSSSRDTAPASYDRLWTVSPKGGPSSLISKQWAHKASYNASGTHLAVERVSRWDSEWRNYKGGQNNPIYILNLKNQSEELLPFENTMDLQPVWLGDKIYFLSDRDWIVNIWSYDTKSKALTQHTNFTGSDVKCLNGHGGSLIFEREGRLHLFNTSDNSIKTLKIEIIGDFPWAETRWEDVSRSISSSSISPNGKRIVFSARGEVFTVPAEKGVTRNITTSSDAADRNAIWSPWGEKIGWFSDQGGQYKLTLADQSGMGTPKIIGIGESKMAWEPTWSPDGKHIAFTDDDVRIRVVNVETGNVRTADVGGTNLQRGRMGLEWSPDSKWLAYSKVQDNNLGRIFAWNVESEKIHALTDPFADAVNPVWDQDKKHLYFMASTDLALGSGWANTSAMTADPNYTAYVINLNKKDPSPFEPESDEESVSNEKDEAKGEKKEDKKKEEHSDNGVVIDFDQLERRTMALPGLSGGVNGLVKGPEGHVFVDMSLPEGRVIRKFSLKDKEAKDFVKGASQFSTSANAKHALFRKGFGWVISSTGGPSGEGGKNITPNLQMKLDRKAEWKQMFEEAWRYERDYFYDPNIHGRNWDEVYKRYSVLIPHVKHRDDLSYILDQINGELSVGHSFVFGGDMPETVPGRVGLLGADLENDGKGWKIGRIYTTEIWNPRLSSPLDRPGIEVKSGDYLVGVNGKPVSVANDPYQYFDGTIGKQTIIHINSKPNFEGSRSIIIEPLSSESALRQRAWVEDNRRMVDKLSGGKLAYIWVPNTSGAGYVSFNRYLFAQQDKEGAVIDERFNGGGLLDDYMVDLMTRKLRAAITNEVPNGKAFKLPAGILGPKVLLVNELAGSGGDFFPWVFRQQNAGPLIGTTTWGGLVKSSVHYALVDGGALTSPDNAVFDPINNKWIGENEGIAPDIEVRQDAKSLNDGKDPQLERAVKEALKLLEAQPQNKVIPPPFNTPAKKKND